MQAVILAAGKGTRLSPLQTPKPLLKIANKTILENNLEQLEGIVDEVIIVTGHKKELMNDFINKVKRNFSFPIVIVEQPEQKGTYDALLRAEPLLKEKFLVMNGDDVYFKNDLPSEGLSILAKEVEDFSRFGILETEGVFLKKISEKPESSASRLANTGLYLLDREVLSVNVQASARGEFELTDAVNLLAEKKKISVRLSKSWLPIGYPWDLLEANEVFLKKIESKIAGEVEKNAVLKGSVSVGKGTLIKSGAYIEGPVSIGENCVIGPNCFIRASTSIGNNCKIGNAVEIKNSIIGDNVSVGHLSYLGDSLLGNNINIGGGTLAANLRHDEKNILVKINGKMVDTGRRKFGTVIGDGVHTGIHTSIYPGRTLDRNTLPGEIIE